MNNLPVAIIGGGPVGLAAAAHLIERNIPFVLFEAGNEVGASIRQWGHIHLFSPWKFNVNKAAKQLLEMDGWLHPNEEDFHTGDELVDIYLKPLANHPRLKPFIHYNSRVKAVGRKGIDKLKTKDRDQVPFTIRYEQEQRIKTIEARAVIDATGTWQTPNPVGSGGIMAEGEERFSNKITYGIPDVLSKKRSTYAGKSVLVVGSGHSAINSIIELSQLQKQEPTTKITWALRKQTVEEAFGGGEADALPARGALGLKIKELVSAKMVEVITPFYIEEISGEDSLVVKGQLGGLYKELTKIDQIITNTGARPDFDFLKEVRISHDPAVESVPALAPLIDPNLHSCGTVRPHGEKELRQPEDDLYIVGMKSYGRAPTFLMATGYEQVRSVVAKLAGDLDAAERVELALPKTGVCKTNSSQTRRAIPLTVNAKPTSCC